MPQPGLIPSEMRTLQGGVNLYGSESKIADHYAVELTNFDARKPGLTVKRKEPVNRAVWDGGFANGIAGYQKTTGDRRIVWAGGGSLYAWNGTNGASIGNGVTKYGVKLPGSEDTYALSATNPVRFANVYDNIYGVDGSSYLFRFNGTEAQAVVGIGQNLPIIPGTVVMTNGTSADDVTDPGADGILKQHGSRVGTIVYETGVYHFEVGFPWASGTVTASHSKPVAQTPETFFRASLDGTLQYMSLAHAPIRAGSSFTLEDEHTNVVHGNTTQYMAMTGWYQLVDTGLSVVGAYNPTLGKFFVDQAAFGPMDAIKATYDYGATSVTNEDHTNPGVVYGETSLNGIGGTYSYFSGMTLGHTKIVPNSIAITASDGDNVADPFCPFTDDGTNVNIGGVNSGICVVNYDSGVIDNGGYNAGTDPHFYDTTVTVNYQYFASQAVNEAVGVADGDGKLYRFATSITTLAAYPVKIAEGGIVVTGTPGGDLYKGASIVGTISATGVVVVTATGTFDALSSPVITYYTAGSISGVGMAFGQVSGALGGSIPFGAVDIIWQNQRLFLASGSDLWYSDALSPESFSHLPKGVGLPIVRILPYSFNKVLMFCGPGANGYSVYLLDGGTGSDPTTWPITIVFDGLALTSFNTILRAASNVQSDVFFETAEGIRTLKTTLQDELSGPSLPLDIHIQPWLPEVNTIAGRDVKFAAVFNDELFRFVPTGTDTFPKTAFVWNMSNAMLQPNSTQLPTDGWSRVELPAAISAAITWDFGGGKKLYAITIDGHVAEMFSASGSATTATVQSKFYTHPRNPMLDIAPQWLTVQCLHEAGGTYHAYLVDDQYRSYDIGTWTVGGSAPTHNTHTFECRDSAGALPSSKEWSVLITTTDYIVFNSWVLECIPENTRHTEMDDNERGSSQAPATMLQSAITPATF